MYKKWFMGGLWFPFLATAQWCLMMSDCADECDEFFETKHLNGYRNEGIHGYLEAFLCMYCCEIVYSIFHFLKM